MKKILMVLVFGLLLGTLIACDDDFALDCAERGGVIDKSTSVGTGVGISPTSGKTVVVTTTTSTRYCIKDGGIIAVD